MIKYSHHYKYCNSIAFSAKVELKGRTNLVETFSFLKKSKELGPVEYFTPEMFKTKAEFEKKIEQMKIEIANDGGGHKDNLPVFNGNSGWGQTQKFDSETESISCIVKAPEWLKDLHGNWLIFFQNKKTGETRMAVNGGHHSGTAEGAELQKKLLESLQGALTLKRIKQTAVEEFMKISKDTTVKEVGNKLIIDINVYLNDLTKAGGVIARHHDVPMATPKTIPGQGGGGIQFKPLSPDIKAPGSK
jgi:hypothetical protein